MQDGLKVWAYEPVRRLDTVDIPWAKVQPELAHSLHMILNLHSAGHGSETLTLGKACYLFCCIAQTWGLHASPAVHAEFTQGACSLHNRRVIVVLTLRCHVMPCYSWSNGSCWDLHKGQWC